MMRGWGWWALPLLAACSNEPVSTTQASNASEAPAATSRPAPPIDGRDGAAPSAGGLTGQVSSLSADRSGLDVRVTDFGTVVALPSDALFDFDKATLTSAAEEDLRKVAELIRQSPAGPIQVVGHTDSRGDDAYNQSLSEARARTVADWFGGQVGVRQREFQVSGKGETAPIAPNETSSGADDAAGRARNRRVEVILPNRA